MNPLPDRVVILSLAITVLLCFAIAAWTARLHTPPSDTLLWRTSPTVPSRSGQQAAPAALPPDGV